MPAPNRQSIVIRNANRMPAQQMRLSLLSIWVPLLSLMMLVMIFGGDHLRANLCQKILAPALGISRNACG